jgi:hypothetical protein
MGVVPIGAIFQVSNGMLIKISAVININFSAHSPIAEAQNSGGLKKYVHG